MLAVIEPLGCGAFIAAAAAELPAMVSEALQKEEREGKQGFGAVGASGNIEGNVH